MARFHTDFHCATRCASLTDEDRQAVGALYHQAGCSSSMANPVCSSSPEQLCVGSCGAGRVDMAAWLPGAFGSSQSSVGHGKDDLQRALATHKHCASQCASEGVKVSVSGPLDLVARQAADMLRQCGVVQLPEASSPAHVDSLERAIAGLRSKTKAYKALLDEVQLHDGRYQVYLPFLKPFNSLDMLGASHLVLAILQDYFGGTDFGIDHASVLTASSPSGNQSLHPDVSYFKGLAVSVHTALQNITLNMGPTYFCPCTGEAMMRDEWPASAAIKMAVLRCKECLGKSLAPQHTPRGTVTIYDGAMFHKGLGNDSGNLRHILKLEVGASDFPQRRDYCASAPPAAQKQVARFRKAFGPPRMGTVAEPPAKNEL